MQYLLVRERGAKSKEREVTTAVSCRTERPVGGEPTVKDAGDSLLSLVLHLETLYHDPRQDVPEHYQTIVTCRGQRGTNFLPLFAFLTISSTIAYVL